VYVRGIVVAYFSVSVFALLFGDQLIHAFSFNDILFVTLFCVLGPFASISFAIWGRGYPAMADWSVHWPIVAFYVVTTTLLAGSFALSIRRNRIARWFGLFGGAVIWVASGYLMFLGLMSI
jgi:hypothetical protein